MDVGYVEKKKETLLKKLQTDMVGKTIEDVVVDKFVTDGHTVSVDTISVYFTDKTSVEVSVSKIKGYLGFEDAYLDVTGFNENGFKNE